MGTPKKIDPLVTDADLAGWDRTQRYFAHDRETPQQVREVYELELAKTRAVVQALVNGINDARFALWAAGKTELANQLAEIELRAKNELNITPKP